MVRLVQRPPLGAAGLIASWALCGLANQATRAEPGRAVAVAASGLERSGAMTRGNQRELARSKNMKKQAEKAKRRDDGLSAAARKQRDSEIMQQKQKAAKEKKEESQQQQQPK